MGNQDEIKEFARMLDLLAMGRNVASEGDLDSEMVRIACTLAAIDLSGLSRNREALRRHFGQRQSTRLDTSPKRGFSMLAAFSMGFAMMIVLAYVSLTIILPLAHRTVREPSVAGTSAGEATLNALLAAMQRLASPTATLSPASATPEASPTVLPSRTSAPFPADTKAPPTPSPAPTWMPTPSPTATLTPWITPTWTPSAPLAWSPPEWVDYILTVQGDVGTVQQFGAQLPLENGATSSVFQVIVNIPPAEGNAGRRRVDYAVTCNGTGTENLRWGWSGWPPASFVCGSIETLDGLLWSQNVVYLVIEVPADGITAVMYTLTVTVGEYSG